MPVVEDVFRRAYSKGARLFIDRAAYSAGAQPAVTETYLNGLQSVAGVKSIKGPKMGRDKVEMMELDQVPAGVDSADLFTANADLTATPTQTREMYFNKVKAPGDKDIGPINLALNMTRQMYGILHQLYVRDIVFPWVINLRTAPNGANTRCFWIGYGFIGELTKDIQPSAIVQVTCNIQTSFGVGFMSTCRSITSLTRAFGNFMIKPNC